MEIFEAIGCQGRFVEAPGPRPYVLGWRYDLLMRLNLRTRADKRAVWR